MGLLQKLYSDNSVREKYFRAGYTFAHAASFLYMGECVGFDSMFNSWARWEQEYASRGYIPFSFDDFFRLTRRSTTDYQSIDVDDFVNNSSVVLHAEIYRKEYLGKTVSPINMNKLLEGKIQYGSFQIPSTEIYAKNQLTSSQ